LGTDGTLSLGTKKQKRFEQKGDVATKRGGLKGGRRADNRDIKEEAFRRMRRRVAIESMFKPSRQGRVELLRVREGKLASPKRTRRYMATEGADNTSRDGWRSLFQIWPKTPPREKPRGDYSIQRVTILNRGTKGLSAELGARRKAKIKRAGPRVGA